MNNYLSSFGENLRIAVIGASGGIGKAFVEALDGSGNVQKIYALSRSGTSFENAKTEDVRIDLEDESTVSKAAEYIGGQGELDVVIVAAGILHDETMQPEKAIKELSPDYFEKAFAINAIGPALAAKHFLPILTKEKKSIFAALSARVGSIEDNHIGGWYSYRASKAALNMTLKNLSIETGRRHKQLIVAGLHPGTVDTELSQPFQKNVPEGKLFTPEYSAEHLLSVMNGLTAEDSGGIFAWDGERIPY